MRKLIFGDGTIPCFVCRVALCGASDHYCSACGVPLREGLMHRMLPEHTAISIALARNEAAARGSVLQ